MRSMRLQRGIDKMIDKYITVVVTIPTNNLDSGFKRFDEDINGMIYIGWQPLGGLCVIQDADGRTITACQSMIKYELSS